MISNGTCAAVMTNLGHFCEWMTKSRKECTLPTWG